MRHVANLAILTTLSACNFHVVFGGESSDADEGGASTTSAPSTTDATTQPDSTDSTHSTDSTTSTTSTTSTESTGASERPCGGQPCVWTTRELARGVGSQSGPLHLLLATDVAEDGLHAFFVDLATPTATYANPQGVELDMSDMVHNRTATDASLVVDADERVHLGLSNTSGPEGTLIEPSGEVTAYTICDYGVLDMALRPLLQFRDDPAGLMAMACGDVLQFGGSAFSTVVSVPQYLDSHDTVLLVDEVGQPIFVSDIYYSLTVTQRDASQWDEQQIGPSPVDFGAAANQGELVIAALESDYGEVGGVPTTDLVLYRETGAELVWEHEPVNRVQVEVDDEGTVHLAWFDAEAGNVHYGWSDGGPWQSMVAGSMGSASIQQLQLHVQATDPWITFVTGAGVAYALQGT